MSVDELELAQENYRRVCEHRDYLVQRLGELMEENANLRTDYKKSLSDTVAVLKERDFAKERARKYEGTIDSLRCQLRQLRGMEDSLKAVLDENHKLKAQMEQWMALYDKIKSMPEGEK